MQRHYVGADSLIGFGVRLLQPRRDVPHLTLRLLHGDAGFQLSDHPQPVGAASDASVVDGEGEPQLGLVGESEAARHDAGHREGLAVELHRLADHIPVAAEALPQAIREQGHFRGARPLLLRQERPAQHRLHTERLEEVAAHACAGNFHRFIAHHHARRIADEHTHMLERLALLLPIAEVFVGHHLAIFAALLARFPDHHHPARVAERQRTQQNGVHHAEHRRARPDAQRHREHRHQGESRILAEGADCVLHVGGPRLDARPAPRAPAVLLQQRGVPELPSSRRVAGLCRLHLQMEPHLLFEIAVELLPPEPEQQLAPQLTEPFHVCSYTVTQAE